MTEPPNDSPPPPKRKRWWRVQLSLAACVAMMVTAALLLWLNFSPCEARPDETELVVVPVYGFPVECAYGEPRVPGYKGSVQDWALSSDPPIPSITAYQTPWDKEDLETKQRRLEASWKVVEWVRASNIERENNAPWRLPANIAANAAMILAVGFLFEFLRRRRERRAILPP